MRDGLFFFKTFLKDPRAISSVIPTRRAVADRIASNIRAKSNLILVEYGPGTGVLADSMLNNPAVRDDAKIVLIEKSKELAERLRHKITDPRVHVHHDSAENVRAILAQHGAEMADYIFSSIPFSIMPDEVVDSILHETSQALAHDGVFTTFLVRATIERRLRDHFPHVRKGRREWINIPPLIVHEASKNGIVMDTKNAGENGVPPALERSIINEVRT